MLTTRLALMYLEFLADNTLRPIFEDMLEEETGKKAYPITPDVWKFLFGDIINCNLLEFRNIYFKHRNNTHFNKYISHNGLNIYYYTYMEEKIKDVRTKKLLIKYITATRGNRRQMRKYPERFTNLTEIIRLANPPQ